MTAGMKVVGDKALKAKFKLLSRRVQNKTARDAIKSGAEPLVEKYRQNFNAMASDEATGQTAAKIRVTSARGKKRKGRVAADIGVRGKRAPIAYWFEMGTSRQRPRPALRSAVVQAESATVGNIQQKFRSGIRSVAVK